MYEKKVLEDTIVYNLQDNYCKPSLTLYSRFKATIEELSEKESKDFFKEIKDSGVVDMIKIEKLMIDQA